MAQSSIMGPKSPTTDAAAPAQAEKPTAYRTLGAMLGGVALAVILAFLSYLLDSDREKVIKRTHGLVESVEKRDWARMATYLHPNVTIATFSVDVTIPVDPTFATDVSLEKYVNT